MKNIIRMVNGIVATGAIVVAPLAYSTGVASASTDYNLTVPIETVIAGSEGTTHEITSKNIDEQYRGMECAVNAVAKNQGSVHPNNNLTVTSNNTFVVLEDVEREGHVITQAKGTLTLGSDVTISLKLGSDKIFSGGMEVNVSCVEPEIEVCRNDSTITIKRSERLSGDTDAPCPESTMNVCRNGKVIVIKESDKKSTDTDAPCPVHINVCRDEKVVRILEDDKLPTDAGVPCEIPTVTVCREGRIVAVEESKRKDTDTDAPCPEVLAATKTLPNTGPGHVIAGVTSMTFIGSTLVARRKMRRS